MEEKLNKLNDRLLHDEKQQNSNNASLKAADKRSLDESELKMLASVIEMARNQSAVFDASHFAMIVDKMLHRWPTAMRPPVLDLIRVLSLHPSFLQLLSFEAVLKILKIAGNGTENAVNGMLCCRIVINLFARRAMARIFEKQYCSIVDALISNALCADRQKTRLAFVRVLLHFAYCFYRIGYRKSNESNIFRAQKLKCF